MTYLKAESMRQELNVAIQYREFDPDKYKNVANKYTAADWMGCRKAILEKLHRDEENITDLIKFVMLVRKGGTL
jgi:hypothetical protein